MKFSDMRVRRLDAGITSQSALAKLLGCYPETILDIERCRIGVDQETYERICLTIDRYAQRGAGAIAAAEVLDPVRATVADATVPDEETPPLSQRGDEPDRRPWRTEGEADRGQSLLPQRG